MTFKLRERERTGPSLLGIGEERRAVPPVNKAGTTHETFHHITGYHGVRIECPNNAKHLSFKSTLGAIRHLVAQGCGGIFVQKMAGNHERANS